MGTQAISFPRSGSNYTPLPRSKGQGRVVTHAVQTINATPEQVYKVYARPELLPAWQEGVVSVTPTGENTLHWVMEDPGTGAQVEFESEIVEAVPGVRHVSRITTGPFESTTETITFTVSPTGRGTVATIVGDYKVPSGLFGNAVAAVASRSPEQITIENLRHLKQLIESTEIPSVEGQPAGPRGVTGKWKQFLMGENLPTPPGSSDRARLRDLPAAGTGDNSGAIFGGAAVLIGLVAWYTLRRR